MESTTIAVLIVLLMAALLPIVPQMVEFRIKALYWIGWDSMAKLHQRVFAQIVVAVRVLFIVVGLIFATKLVTD